MGYVPSIYKFADPVNSSYRLYYISTPFFKDGDLEAKLKKPYTEVFAQVKHDVKTKVHGVFQLGLYLHGHKMLVENSDKLKNYDVIMVPSVSASLTDDGNVLGKKPGKQGMDFFSNNVRLPNDILSAYQGAYDLYVKDTGKEPGNYQRELIVPLAHFISPLRIFRRPDGVFGLEFLFKNELENITTARSNEHKKGFGTLMRCADDSFTDVTKGVEGNYEFSERMFLPNRAKTKEEKQHTLINRTLGSQSVIWLLQSKDYLYWYAEKGKYMGLIKERLPKEYRCKIKDIGGKEGILRGKNASLSGLGPSSKTAIGILEGFLYRKWLTENGVEIRPKRLGVKNARLFA
jgi:hypothetical protein